MSIFKASSKKENLLLFQNHNFLFVRTPQYETYYDSRFGRKVEKINMFFKAIYGEQQKIKFLGKITNCLNHSPQTVRKIVILWQIEAVFACYGALFMSNGCSPG